MIITDKDGFGWALSDCSDISMARVLLEEYDNTYYVGIQLKGDRGFSQIPFATKEEAESVLKEIDAAMEAVRNHWNPTHVKTESRWDITFVKDAILKEAEEYYKEAKLAEDNAKKLEEKARQLNKNAKRYYDNVMENNKDYKDAFN